MLLLHGAHGLHRHPHHPHAIGKHEEDEGVLREPEAQGHRENRWREGSPIGHLLRFPEGIDAEGVLLAARHQEGNQAKQDDEAGVDACEDASILPGRGDFGGFVGFVHDIGIERPNFIYISRLMRFQLVAIGVFDAAGKGSKVGAVKLFVGAGEGNDVVAGGIGLFREADAAFAKGKIRTLNRGDFAFGVTGFAFGGFVAVQVGEEGRVIKRGVVEEHFKDRSVARGGTGHGVPLGATGEAGLVGQAEGVVIDDKTGRVLLFDAVIIENEVIGEFGKALVI